MWLLSKYRIHFFTYISQQLPIKNGSFRSYWFNAENNLLVIIYIARFDNTVSSKSVKQHPEIFTAAALLMAHFGICGTTFLRVLVSNILLEKTLLHCFDVLLMSYFPSVIGQELREFTHDELTSKYL